MPIEISIIIAVASLILGALIGVFVGIAYRKNIAEKEIGSAEEEANKIVSEAMKTAEAKKKEAILEGKDEIHRQLHESLSGHHRCFQQKSLRHDAEFL